MNKLIIKFSLLFINYIKKKLGIGDWGLGIGDWGLGPIPNPQSPFEYNQTIWLLIILKKINIINKKQNCTLSLIYYNFSLLLQINYILITVKNWLKQKE